MKKSILFTFFIISLSLSIVNSQTITPMLTLNTEMHTAKIGRLSTDKLGKYVLTCSIDKTAKLWNATTGSLIKTLRIPIDEGNEGMINACALSPDGKLAVLGGYTGKTGMNKNVYLYDIATNTMLQRITGLTNVITDIEFSQDGNYVVVNLAGEQGIKVYQVSGTTLTLFKSLTDYGAATYNSAFDNTGRLATASWDGNIRIYNSSFELVKTFKTTNGVKPFAVAFSPDGTLLAVGYKDTYKIEVRDSKTLELLYEPDITGASTVANRLEMVTFSYDGLYLLAGGSYSSYVNGSYWFQIRVWKNKGKGKGTYIDCPAGDNSIMDIKPMPDNSFVYSGSNPDFGRIKIDGTKVYYKAAETNVYSSKDVSHLKINDYGTEIGVTSSGKTAISFSVDDRKLSSPVSFTIPSEMKSYVDSYSGVTVTDWNSSYSPKINSKAITFFDTNEKNESVDISKDAKKIVLGTGWNVYCCDASGTKLWAAPVQGTAYCVNISGNDKVVIAGLGDGTVRWYSMADGTLLLTLYLNPDNSRWVLWTKSGYYDCSVGAEDLIGWHLNNTADKEASYYPASKFRDVYYRTDVVAKILQTLDEAKAIELANTESNKKTVVKDITKMLPPTVTIVSPDDGYVSSSNTISVKYSVNSPNNKPITSVKVLVDGRATETNRGFVEVYDTEATTNVTIPSENCKISVIAENEFGFSEAAIVNIVWSGKTVAVTDVADILKPNLYVLAVGVSKYDKPNYILNYAAKDAKDFSEKIALQKGGLYNIVTVKLLTDADATKDNILDGLDWIQKQTTSRDVAMIFIAGHGTNDATGVFYYLPVNADVDYMKRSCLMFSDIQTTVSAIAGKVILFIDACHSGNVFGSAVTRAVDINSFVNELSSAENGAVVFTSSTGKQYSQESDVWQNGAFTEALLKGMSGEADYEKTGVVTVKYLDAYIANKVKELTKGSQAPTTIIPTSIPDFPILIVK